MKNRIVVLHTWRERESRFGNYYIIILILVDWLLGRILLLVFWFLLCGTRVIVHVSVTESGRFVDFVDIVLDCAIDYSFKYLLFVNGLHLQSNFNNFHILIDGRFAFHAK